MNSILTTTQKSSDKTWYDEKGTPIPYSRTTKTERLKERKSRQLFAKAETVNKYLMDYKNLIREVCNEVFETYMRENGIDRKDHKGNFTWYNFDRSIKIEVSVNEKIEFDDLSITAAKDLLHEFLDANVQSEDELIKELVLDAFETTRGNLDPKKIFSLIQYESKIKNSKFQQAVKLLKDGIRRTDSKVYFRIAGKNTEGKYENIDLNLSSI